MKTSHLIGAAALIFASAGMTAAIAQPEWAPPADWGPGWHHWQEHRVAAANWEGPTWYDGPGEHHGWYQWNNNWYQHCGWRWRDEHRRDRDWRCY